MNTSVKYVIFASVTSIMMEHMENKEKYHE